MSKLSVPTEVKSLDEIMQFLHTLVNSFNEAGTLIDELQQRVDKLQEEVTTLKGAVDAAAVI